VADALVARGLVGSRAEAFERYLSPGRPGYARRFAADLEDVIPMVVAAGGVPVIAHPWGRTARAELTEAAFARLKVIGLAGIEVDHQDHDAASRDALRAIARNLDLVVTGSSDHHGAGKVDHDLGCNTTAPEELARIRELADAARAARVTR
jgi:predicted metal-dependent phosphoesterase TrpH